MLVAAGAGAGKTRTLVERCLDWLREDRENQSIDQILMVTFTEAAGAEMRQRLRKALSAEAGWETQLALLETANIGTLHGFCLRLIRRHFYDLGLDPQLAVLDEDQSRLLANEALDLVLEEFCNVETPKAEAARAFILDHGHGWDQPVREVILRVHAYTQTLPNPGAWFEAQLAGFAASEPVQWRQWLNAELRNWRANWLPVLERLARTNSKADELAKILSTPPEDARQNEFSKTLQAVLDADLDWPPKQKTRLRAPIEKLFEEASFLHSVCAVGGGEPLAEDWEWSRHSMRALLEMARRFEAVFSAAKREAGGVDFHDLEQFALQLLWDRNTNEPTALAKEWRQKFKLVFVDEYQDINAAQDAILRALGGEGAEANRFLVGDVKQSIYRFRLADPRIFLDYQARWSRAGADGRVIHLPDNFRSHEAVLKCVNALFSVIMRRELGGVEYDEAARLKFGAPAERKEFSCAASKGEPRIELHLRIPDKESGNQDDLPLSESDREARLVGQRLLEFKQHPAMIRDHGALRPAAWSDMVILLRSPRARVESYVKEFARLGIPLEAARGGFYESLEIRDLLSLLQILDNPLQDYPLLAVLRSPFAGLTNGELAAIRIARRKGSFWTALVAWNESAGNEKSARFLKRYNVWREATRHETVSHCLERILDETHYAQWLLAQDRGTQRRENVERLLRLTRQFDLFQREGLYRFLRYVDARQEGEIDTEPAAVSSGDAVRLMSIHQSKGLEFPIVVVADLGRRFNFQDTTGKIILDEELGLCAQIKPPHARQFYPSLPFWMARRRQKRETLGEELRLLYVAMTRAIERLVLVGTAGGESSLERWGKAAACDASDLLSSTSCLGWIAPWLCHVNQTDLLDGSGANSLLKWMIHQETQEEFVFGQEPPPDLPEIPPDPATLRALEERLQWRYAYLESARRPAKTSVSVLRRELADEESEHPFDKPRFRKKAAHSAGKLSAAEIGTAHHAFLEQVALDQTGTVEGLRAEANRLRSINALNADQAACLDFDALTAFWQSPIGRDFRDNAAFVHRELPFTARFAAAEIGQTNLPDEFIVVQGVVDLAAILPDQIWLLDFKTDAVTEADIGEKLHAYRPQIHLYARALERIYNRPVTRRWLHFLQAHQSVIIEQ